MGKWAKPDLSDLETDLLNNSMESISLKLINIIPKKLCTKNKKTLSNRFQTLKKTSGVIQSNPSFGSPSAPSLGSFMTKLRKVIKQFLRKLPPNGIWAKFDLSDL